MKLTITTISDTHNRHKRIIYPLPPADVLVHAGDFSSRGHEYEVEDFFKWFKRKPYPYKILIAGNHDISFEGKRPEKIQEMIDDFTSDPCNFYLEDSGCQIEGVNFWGSPYTPQFGRPGWAFNSIRGEDIRSHWDKIPPDTHVLITHGPAAYKCDFANANPPKYPIAEYVGCEDLARAIQQIKPLLHICGHVHEAYGIAEDKDTVYINTAICNLSYEPINKPFNLEVDIQEKIVNPI
jgi:hypothetical protein